MVRSFGQAFRVRDGNPIKEAHIHNRCSIRECKSPGGT